MINRFRIFTFLVAVLAGVVARAQAGDACEYDDSLDVSTLNEVVVMSFKQQRDIRLEPISASIIKEGVLDKRNVASIKDLNGYVPNLFMPDYGSKLTSPVFIRGIGSKINSPSVGLYVDGMPYFEKNAFDFDFSDIEHVEVLRGPQGTLYGRNTMGGIINISTHSPLRTQRSMIKAGAGMYGSWIASGMRSDKISDALGYSISANYDRTGGYITNNYTGNKCDDGQEASARMRWEWRPTSRLTMSLVSAYDFSSQRGYPYAEVDKESMTVGAVEYDAPGKYRRNMLNAGIVAEYKGAGFSINSRAAYQHIADNQQIDQDFSPDRVYFATQRMRQHQASEELVVKSTSSGRYHWLCGVFGFYQGIDNNVGLQYIARDYATTKLYDNPAYGGALFHQSTIDNLLVKGMSLTVGLRYDIERASTEYRYFKHAVGATEISSAPESSFDEHLSFSQLCPKIALQYMFASTGIVYASVTKGYKAGGFNTSFDTEADRTFKPETSWNYEVGAKHPFLDDKCNAEVALFFIDWRNQQIYQSLATQTGQLLRNAGRSVSKGVEVSIQYNPVPSLLLQANYGYTHATFKRYADDRKGIDYKGNRLPLVPAQTLGLDADYTFSRLGPFDSVILGASFIGTGRIYWNESNLAKQKGYGLLNAKMSGSIGICTLQLWARNITGTRYMAYYFESGSRGLAQKGRPFTCGANLILNF